MDNCKILAIETSCDDSCVALMQNNRIISNVILSSCEKQNEYGGVVPELAAREHEKNILNAFISATKDTTIDDIDFIAYTQTPGLRVCLNVGEAFAYSLANLLDAKILPINHIYGHIFSFAYNLEQKQINFPFLSLVASGGHTTIFLVNSVTDIKILNETTDDAIGEVYDKVARVLNLGYPGGPRIDHLYNQEKANIIFLNHLPSADQPFSFSGLKTSVLNYINQLHMKNKKIDIEQIASSFQKQAIDMIIKKIKYYLELYKIDTLAIGGGVSANKLLQTEVKKLNLKNVYIPDIKLCGDNAAMIAIYANLLVNQD